MTKELMLSMLEKGETGDQLLDILDAILGVNEEKETVAFAMMPSEGMILDAYGREVVF
jgi:hypothetical protein